MTAGRAVVAGLLSLLYLWARHAPRPARKHGPALLVSGLGTVVGFPLCLAMALREVESTHAAVVSSTIPLATALVAAWSLRQRPSAGFWACALAGFGLVLGYAAWLGFAYVSVFSMWLGFFAWYRGLALGVVVRVSQVQLLQPFLAILFAVPVLGERLQPAAVACALAVIVIAFIGRRTAVRGGTPRGGA